MLPSYAGLRISQEVAKLSQILHSPTHPFLAIIGGAKIETKLPTIEKLQSLADYLFVGGKLPHEITIQGLKFPSNVQVATMNSSGLDIDELSTTQLLDQVKSAKLIVWNGPLGKFEDPTAQAGTKALCEALKLSSAYKAIGGGETISAINTFHAESSINFISVGGGAMLEFLSGKQLPAIAALN
jgi:phosphoglycerate kinase